MPKEIKFYFSYEFCKKKSKATLLQNKIRKILKIDFFFVSGFSLANVSNAKGCPICFTPIEE
jgi:hypothetical protein